MRKILKIVLFVCLNINILSETTTKLPYGDITNEHWAYKSIENLYKKGILDLNNNIFNGEKPINRFDMAYFLSKTLDRIENDKADRADLIVIEHIVYEFSDELAKFGFDSSTYLKKVDTFEAKLEENRVANEENKSGIIKLETKVEELEKNLNKKNQFLTQDTTINSKLDFFNDFSVYLKSNIDYNINTVSADKKFKGAHQLGLTLKRNSYELFLESETSDKERKNGELIVKGQIETEIIDGYRLNFHTSDYERYLRSYFNNVIYDNHNSYEYSDGSKTYQYDSFDSYGLAIANSNMGVYVEKTRTDYDGNYSAYSSNLSGVTIDQGFSDTFNFITKFNYDYIEALILKNGNNKNLDFEIAGKYPLKKLELVLAYSEKNGESRTLSGISNSDAEKYNLLFDKLSFVNGEIYYGGKNNFSMGFEIKSSEEERLYKAYYGTYKYNLTTNGKIKYKYEYVDRENKEDYKNHYFVINIYGDKINTYGAYNIISLNKKYLINSSLYPIEKNYNETLIKSTFKISEDASVKVGYLMREYKNSEYEKSEISFIQGQYNFDKNTMVFLKYIKNTGENDFNDRKLDIDNNMVDLDFSNKTGAIRKASDGRIELGIELIF